jgi:misacylated tRNA(Ala) deacylase
MKKSVAKKQICEYDSQNCHCRKEAMPKEYDPRMHSAEHILNQTMVRMFNCGRSFSMHLEKKKSKCDYHFGRELSPDEVRQLELLVNGIIQSNAAVQEEFLPRDDAAKQFSLSRLPDQNAEMIRIIKIGEYDACPCIGEHVKMTKEIGIFKIVSTSHENGVLRVRFRLSDSA